MYCGSKRVPRRSPDPFRLLSSRRGPWGVPAIATTRCMLCSPASAWRMWRLAHVAPARTRRRFDGEGERPAAGLSRALCRRSPRRRRRSPGCGSSSRRRTRKARRARGYGGYGAVTGTSYAIPYSSPTRPRRHAAVKRLRRSCAPLRRLRRDRVLSARRVAAMSRWRPATALGRFTGRRSAACRARD
jgi:hypothetical protein